MAKNTKSARGLQPGQQIGDFYCERSAFYGDIIVAWNREGEARVFTKSSVEKGKPSAYKIERKSITQVFLPRDHQILILKTAQEAFIRDYNNKPLKYSEFWADYYFEPINRNFYRQDTFGQWYDIEGHRLDAVVFLQDDVLVSLLGKASRQSLSYKGQELTISPSGTLIQVGKLVLDEKLNRVRYYGEKVTGLGGKNIRLAEGLRVQEICLGLQDRAFILEESKQPFLINKDKVVQHLSSEERGRKRFERFRTSKGEYVVEHRELVAFTCDGKPVSLDFKHYYQIGTLELMLCKRQHQSHYMDINSRSSFFLKEICPTAINYIGPEAKLMHGYRLRNMRTTRKQFVYNENLNAIFTLNDGQVVPQAIEEPPNYSKHYGIALIGNVKKLFYKKTNTIVRLPEEEVEIEMILSGPHQKLLNVRSTDGQELVVDARKGYDRLQRARSNDRAVVKVFGQPHALGSAIVQNCRLETLGGTEKRVLDLNKEALPLFTLPLDLRAYPENQDPSVFHGSPLIELDLDTPVTIDEEIFYSGTFLPFYDTPTPILLQGINGRPLHLEGGGHRNELIISFQQNTLRVPYYLGEHRMIGAITLTEEGKEQELVFSFTAKKSWLEFKDSYLPIFRKIVPLQNAAEWAYVFFELRRISSETEYIVVERNTPYRILVEKKRRKEIPKIIHTTERRLKAPAELSLLKRIFKDDPGYLEEIY
ncbi:MAG: hypothetical protein AAGG75_14450 [Bacteroidota bacterium]